MATVITKTPIIYYGGKTSILNYLLDRVPLHEVYTETFFGGGTLFWAKDPVKNETINDRLDIVINFYKVLRTNYRSLKKLIDATLISRTIHNEALDLIRMYKKSYEAKSTNMNQSSRVALAWAFWVKSNFSHMNKLNGGYKQEKDGGRSIAQSLQNRKNEFTELLVKRIENTTIENTDYSIVLDARNSVKAFHYLDPIYPGTDPGTYGYFGHKWSWEDYEQLLNWCALHCKGKFLLSSYPSPLLDSYIHKFFWNKIEISHRLKQARKNGTQTHRVELLVSNYSNTCNTLRLF